MIDCATYEFTTWFIHKCQWDKLRLRIWPQ